MNERTKLQKFRVENDYTLKALANICKIPVTTLSSIESGVSNPNRRNKYKILYALKRIDKSINESIFESAS